MLTAESLQRRVVLTSDGVVIGSVNKLFIRPEDWRIATFEVKLRKEAAERMGVEHKLFRAPTLEIPADLVQSTGDAVLLSVPLASLRATIPQPQPAPQLPTQPTPIR
jgi:sporulation protein YlmC with PRC-barrel domain